MWQSVENRGKKKTDGTSKHGSPSSKANKGNCFVAVATEILGFVYECGLTVGLTGVVYASEEASDVPPEDKSFHPAGLPSSTESLQPASSASSQGEPAAVQPVIGISQRVHTGPKKKKDLGTLGTAFLQYSSIIPTCISSLSHHSLSVLCFSLKGYVLGILMMAIIIILGAGITFGYFYKRYCSTLCQIYVKTHILSWWPNGELLLQLCVKTPMILYYYDKLSTHPVGGICR